MSWQSQGSFRDVKRPFQRFIEERTAVGKLS
jgi:hypothetical protein